MSSSVLAGSVPAVPGVRARLLRRLLMPSLSDCLFLSMIVWLFMVNPDGWSRLLLDGDTGWHIRAGEWVLANKAIPHTDLFSFSMQDKPWFAWEWGTDVILGLLHGAAGLKGIALFGGVLIAIYATLLFRYMLWRGANPLLALGFGLVAVSASSVHYLARPHLSTLVLVPATVWMLDRDRSKPGPAIWLLIPLTAVWTNLHGGFMALIACAGLLAIGTGIETLLSDEGRLSHWRDLLGYPWRAFRRYSFLAAGCAAASLANPYGVELHRHVIAYLKSDWIRNAVQEFQSPRFRNENMFQFEALLLIALVFCWRLLARRRVTEVLWILFWAHQALGSVRHVTVFVSIAAPIVAAEATGLWDNWVRPASRRSVRRILDSMSTDLRPGFLTTSLWPFLFVGALCLLGSPLRWPSDFPDVVFPTAMVAKHSERIATARVFTTDQWADYLIYRHYPEQRVFIDGRSDFYGPGLGQQYLRASEGHWDWRRILDRHRLDLVLSPPDWALASLLKQDPEWRLIEDDGKALLFELRKPYEPIRPAGLPKKTTPILMESSPPSEFSMGDLGAVKQRSVISEEAAKPRNGAETGQWILPSGQPLGEFAMRSGLAAWALLWRPEAPRAATGAGARNRKFREGF